MARLTVPRNGLHKAAEEWASTAPATPFGPHTSVGSPVPQSASASAWFRYIMSHGYAAVHEPARALELWSAATAATDPFNERNVMSHLQARKDYYEVLGDEKQFTSMLDLVPKRRGSIFT